jgi:GT2 family glycosyltransferase
VLLWYIDEPLVRYRLGGISDPEKMNNHKWNRHVKETLRQRVSDAFHCGRLDIVNLLWHIYDSTGFSLRIEERIIPAGENFSLSNNQLDSITENQLKEVSFYSAYLTRHQSPFHPDDPLSADSPTVTFVVPCPASELPLLADTLDSLGVQSAPLWRLVVVADTPAPDAMWTELPMLRWREVESAEGMEAALAEELAAVESGWVSVLAPGVRLAADAVEQLVRHALAFPQWRLMYGDSDTVDADGARRDPLFRPDLNLDLLRSMPYLGPCLWVEREAFAAVGGLGEQGGAWRYDLALRVLDAFGEEAIGHVDGVLYSLPAGREEAVDEPAHRQALAAHLARRGLEAEVAEGYVPGTWRVVYHWPRQPRVSIIIPTKDQADYLQSCVESIRAKTAYPDYEILVVDNGSTQPEALAYLERLKAEGVRVLPYPKPFNFSAMCNLAAREASGEYLLLLNNDTAVLQEHWLERMVAYGQRPDVGIVGVKLMFPHPQTVQHVGVILGLGGIAEHPYLGLLGLADGGYMNRALVDQDLSAVTAACLLIRKAVWEEVKGLDEQAFRVSYNDVDLCLKVRERGYKILWTPFVVLVHHGSVSQQQEAAEPAKARKAQQRFGKEQEAMLRKWLPQLARDPAYNRHLSLTHRDYRVESEIVVNWDPRLPSEKVRVLGWEQLSGVIEYRIKQPLEGLWQARAAERSFIHAPGVRQTRIPLLVEVERAKPDVFTASAFLELSDHLETVRQVQEIAGIPFLLHLDDLISEIPRQSEVYEHRNTPGEMKRLVRTADRVVVTTEPIRSAIEKYAREVRLIPNYLPGWVWNGLKSERRVGPKPRVGWAGAMQHAGDLALIREVVEATSEECDWVFFGMCPEELRPFVKEFHPFVPFEQYPAKLASLDLDLAVAPLEVNRFNEYKSNLRLLEYGILGWPVVCSDVLPYRGAPVARVPNRTDAWLEAIRARIHDLDAAQKEGEALRQWVREGWMLEDHLDEWLEAYRLGL